MHAPAQAQVRRDTTRADSARARGDSLRRIGRDSAAVGIPLPPDSAKADSVRARQRADSIRAIELARRAADTIKAPLAHAEVPPLADIGQPYRWNRQELFASGALTLGELLGRIPGVTAFASGWIASPQVDTYVGDFRRIRLFYDGVELDPLDPTVGPMHDFAGISIWTLEELVVERAAEELRVYMRSWRVNKTTPNTRVDVATGDLSTNSYRGYFGRRLHNGGALQLGAQQYSTEDPRAGGDGDMLSIFGRLGWAKKAWSADAVLLRTRRNRNEQEREESFSLDKAAGNLPALDGTRSDAYFRVGYGNTDGARWLQLIAATSRFVRTETRTDTTDATITTDTVDINASHAQFVATAGVRLLGTSVSATARYRTFNGWWYLTPSARLGFDRGILSATAFAEQQVTDSTFRGDVSARLRLLPFLSLSGSVGRTSPIDGSERPASLAYRGELGLRVGRLWATGGVMSLDTTIVPAPMVYDTLYAPDTVGARRALFATLRGPVWKGIGFDVVGTKWSAGDYPGYVPEYQVRSTLYASTSWLSKFPQGNFHVLAEVSHEYRSKVPFPIVGGGFQESDDETPTPRAFRVISTLFELRLYDAVISWQYRNILGEIYNVVPGFTAPRAINYYGVRWDFFN